MLFGKNKKKNEKQEVIKKRPLSIGEMYLECVDYYIAYQGKLRGIENPIHDKEFYQEWAAPFYNSAMHFVNYLENQYPDQSLTEDIVIDFNLEEMLENADETAKTLFNKPLFPGLIYINDKQYSTHFHTNGDVIVDTEGIQVLPGLSNLLANDKINKLFNGLNPIEARALLKQMGIYPKDTELDSVISDYYERETINKGFLKSIICLLLIRRSEYGIKRARLFADSLGIYFDFEPFEKKTEYSLKKEL